MKWQLYLKFYVRSYDNLTIISIVTKEMKHQQNLIKKLCRPVSLGSEK